jgi:hypothetical protein
MRFGILKILKKKNSPVPKGTTELSLVGGNGKYTYLFRVKGHICFEKF